MELRDQDLPAQTTECEACAAGKPCDAVQPVVIAGTRGYRPSRQRDI